MIRVPTEVIKTRTQTSTYGLLGQSSLAAARLVLTNDGWRGFYRGFRSTIMREVRFFSGGVLSYSADDNFILDTFYLIAISVIRVVEATTFPKSRADTALRP